MPFSEPLSYTSPYRGPAEVRGRTHGALHVFIQEPVIEAREEGGREAVSGEQTVRRRFLCGQVLGVFGGGVWRRTRSRTFAVDQDFRVLAVCAQEDGLVVYVRLGQTGLLVDGLEKLRAW